MKSSRIGDLRTDGDGPTPRKVSQALKADARKRAERDRYGRVVDGLGLDQYDRKALRDLKPWLHGTQQPQNVRSRITFFSDRGFIVYDAERGWNLTDLGRTAAAGDPATRKRGGT